MMLYLTNKPANEDFISVISIFFNMLLDNSNIELEGCQESLAAKDGQPDFLPWTFPPLPAQREGRQDCGIARYIGFYTFLHHIVYRTVHRERQNQAHLRGGLENARRRTSGITPMSTRRVVQGGIFGTIMFESVMCQKRAGVFTCGLV